MRKVKVLSCVLCLLCLSSCGTKAEYVLQPSGFNTTTAMEICLPPETEGQDMPENEGQSGNVVENEAVKRLTAVRDYLNSGSLTLDFLVTEQDIATGAVRKAEYKTRYADGCSYVSETDADGFCYEYITKDAKTYSLDSLFLEAVEVEAFSTPYAKITDLDILFAEGTETFVETADLNYKDRTYIGDTYTVQGSTYTIAYDGSTVVLIKSESSDKRKLVEISNIGACMDTECFSIPDGYTMV